MPVYCDFQHNASGLWFFSLGTQHDVSELWSFNSVFSTMPVYYDLFTWYTAQYQCTLTLFLGTQHNASVHWLFHFVLSIFPVIVWLFHLVFSAMQVYCDPFIVYSAQCQCTVILSLCTQHNVSVLWFLIWYSAQCQCTLIDSFTWASAQCQFTVILSIGTRYNAGVLWSINLELSIMPVYCDLFTRYSAQYQCTLTLLLDTHHTESEL